MESELLPCPQFSEELREKLIAHFDKLWPCHLAPSTYGYAEMDGMDKPFGSMIFNAFNYGVQFGLLTARGAQIMQNGEDHSFRIPFTKWRLTGDV